MNELPMKNSLTSMAVSKSVGIDPDEQEKFARLANQWWDPHGPMRPLHMINPVRLDYLVERITRHYGEFSGLSILDIGCAAGLTSFPLARLGGEVLGIDATPSLIQAAEAHYQSLGDLAPAHLSFRCATLAELAARRDSFDVVLALEVVEHVEDVSAFLQACLSMVKPGGLLILSTLNRNLKSWALGIIAAEYILNWLPKGTHQWQKFLTPSELVAALGPSVKLMDLSGLVYQPWRQQFVIKQGDVSVNYLAQFCKF